jgi:hypothetical protein
VRAVSIPGIDYGDGAPGSTGTGNFRVVEPRPVFVKGRLVYLTSIIPKEANAVSKTVVVDAETNKLVAIFNNDRDDQAEAKTLRYIETGEIPDEAEAAGVTDPTPEEEPAPTTTTPGATGTTTTPGGTTTTPGGGGVGRRLDDVIRRQRELLREIERLRDEVRRNP